MPVNPEEAAPYAPAKAILSIVDRHRSKGIPAPVDADTLGRAGISDSLIPRTLQALHILDLIDGDGNPTDTLEGLRLSPESEFHDRMADWLRGAYADALQYIEPDADETSIRDAFRSYNPIGQQPRMVSLFTGLMAEAGLRDKAESKPATRKPATNTGRTRKRKTNLGGSGGQGGGGALQKMNLPPAISGLLQSLPDVGSGWVQTERDKFIATFGAVIDFCYPIVEKSDLDMEQQNDEEDTDI